MIVLCGSWTGCEKGQREFVPDHPDIEYLEAIGREWPSDFGSWRWSLNMAKKRKSQGLMIAKILIGIILAVVAYLGLTYGSMLKEMDAAASDYSRGDLETALKRYETVEEKLRGFKVPLSKVDGLRVIPARDRHNLFLNQARMLYTMRQYNDAAERLEKENEISGITTDSRFFLLRGNINFRKAVTTYQQSQKKDANLLEENLLGAEDSIKESLQMYPADWDAKYNYEFINNVRKMLTSKDSEKVKLLMEEEAKPQTKELPPELAG
jgi:tetratricopeptide (TPR) repeat protein